MFFYLFPIISDINFDTSYANKNFKDFLLRILSRPTTMTSQLTIFYAGAVNVYNDIPLDKVLNFVIYLSQG